MQKLDCAEFGSCRIRIVENMDNLDFAEFRLCRNWMLQNCLSHCAYVQHWYLKDSFCTLFFCPRTCPRAFLQSFALYFLCSKAKDCRNVLGRVLGRKNKVHAPSFSQRYTYRAQKVQANLSFLPSMKKLSQRIRGYFWVLLDYDE